MNANAEARPSERVRFLEYGGQRVLLLDYIDCAPEDVFDMMQECERIVIASPPNSVLTLSDFTNGRFTKEGVQRMKEVAALDGPHVKRAAFVGISSLPGAFHQAIRNFSVRDFTVFETREEALVWLTADQ